MKKYLRVSCTVCKRSADRLVDNTHFTPDKCTITLRCEGRLFPVQYRSDGGITSAPEVGIVDWRARNTIVNAPLSVSNTEVLIDTSTGGTKQVVLAVRTSFVPPSTDVLDLTFDVQNNTPKSFKQFVYRSDTPFSTISGVESGLEKKTLRFGLTDSVQVFLNGVELQIGLLSDDFQIYDGTPSSPVPPNTIKFNQTLSLPGVTQVDVIVAPPTVVTQVSVRFNRNENDESRLGTGAWENVDYVQFFNNGTLQKFYLFTLDLGDATQLVLNTILTPASILINGIVLVPIADAKLLLGRAPYSTLDRYTTLWVPMDGMNFERDYFKFTAKDGAPTLNITETSIHSVFPPLKVSKFNIEKTIQTFLGGVSDQIVIDGNVIVGPDS